MSDAMKLKEVIDEYRKANKVLDERLNKIETDSHRRRQEQADSQSRPN